MDKILKNKMFTWLLALLLLANAVTLVFFWIGRPKPGAPKGEPANFLAKELKFSTEQQQQFEELRQDHMKKVQALREKVKAAKDEMFDLVKDPGATDSTKQSAARKVSALTEAIDVYTINHFQQVRALCNAEQQKKFDGIIHDLTRMMGGQRGGGLGGPGGPPPGPGEHGGPGGPGHMGPPEGPDGEPGRPGPPPGEQPNSN